VIGIALKLTVSQVAHRNILVALASLSTQIIRGGDWTPISWRI
jgi:hypothetical protein